MKPSRSYTAFAALVQNRLTPRVMEAGVKSKSSPPLPAAGGGTDQNAPSWAGVVIVCAVALVACFVAGALPEPLPFALLCVLAATGVFFMLAAASGRIVFQPASERGSETIADAWPDGVLITNRLGTAVYVNAAFDALVPATSDGGLSSLEQWLAGEPAASEALFRLVRAGERGEARTEEFALPLSYAAGPRRTCRLSVAPIEVASRERQPLVLWRVSDITREHEQKHLAERATELRLDAYGEAPAGMLVLDPAHNVLHMNSTLEGWLGLSQTTGDDGHATLDAVFSGGADVLRRHFERYPTTPFQCPLEVGLRGGRRLPVRVIVGAPVPIGQSLAGSRIVVIVRAEWADPTAGEATDGTYARPYQAAPFGIAIITHEGIITSSNPAFASMILDGGGGFDERAADVLARDCTPEVRASIERYILDAVTGPGSQQPIDFHADRNGRSAARRIYAVPLAPSAASRDAAILYVVDTTEQRELEAKFAQSQKMEAIGKLAGEMAHNFNNVLTAIIGSAELMLQTFRASDPAHKDIQNIRQSAFRAAELVNQLMSFSRQQTLRLEYAHLGEWLTELKPTVKASLGEKIDLKISSDRDLWYAHADRTQIQQVLMNFASNSRDAMPGGGAFKLNARNIAEREVLRMDEPGLPVGEYVMIEAEDNGGGMPEHVRTKIFDPFFTTKDIGKGTGLGLASVYGIVKQLSGFIFCKSEVGQGTTFRIFLPRAYPDAEAELVQTQRAAKNDAKPIDLTGSATVLIVDDDDMVRSVAKRQLDRLGYRVLEASNGQEALDVIAVERGGVDIVISDVVMPEMDGPAFLKAVRPLHPELKIIFVSGHTNDAFREAMGDDGSFAFLQKPFSLPKLAEKVKEELRR